MGICFKKKETANSKYYKIIQATIKNLYDKNHYNPFNQAYNLISNKLVFVVQVQKYYIMIVIIISPGNIIFSKN